MMFVLISPAQSMERSLKQLITKAIENSPEIHSFKTKIEIAELEIAQYSNLNDPVLGLGLANLPVNSLSFDREPMTGKVVSLSQSFPFPGKLSSMESVYQSEVEVAKQDLVDAKWNVRRNLLDAIFDLAIVQTKTRLLNEKRELLETLLPVIRTQYEVSKAPQQNLLLLQFNITNISDKEAELKSVEGEKKAIISGLLYEEVQTDVSGLLEKDVDWPLSLDDLLNKAIMNKPSLLKTQILIEKSIRQEDLANYEFYPNFNLGIQYSQRDALQSTGVDLNDFISFNLGVSLPINYGGKKSAAVSKTKKLNELYKTNYENQIQWLKISLNRSLERITSLLTRQKLLAESLTASATESFKSSITGYKTGTVDFLNVIDSLNKLIELQDEQYTIRKDFHKEIALLEYLTGSELLADQSIEVNHEK